MKIIVLALILLNITSATAAPSMLETLSPHAGIYVLVQNNPANPCRAGGSFELGSETRLNIFSHPENTEYFIKGDTIVALEQWFEGLNKWGTRFDRASFAYINKGTKRHWLPSLGMVISHQSIFNAAESELSQSATMSTLQGRGEGVQTIKFMGNDSFLYTYVINDRNTFGKLLKSTPAGECEFSRKQ